MESTSIEAEGASANRGAPGSSIELPSGEEGHELRAILDYFRVACTFRHEEMRLQYNRSAVFTFIHAGLMAAAASTLERSLLPAAIVATLGFFLGLLWCAYYRGSVYWVRFWEQKCSRIDAELRQIPSDLRLFADHPAGASKPVPEALVLFDGKQVRRSDALPTLFWVIVLSTVAWFSAAIILWIGVGLGWGGFGVP